MSASNPRNEVGQQPRGDVRAAVDAILNAAKATEGQGFQEIVAGQLSRLREDFGETEDLVLQVHRALDLLQENLYHQETKRRIETDEGRLRAVQLRLIREELVGLAPRLDSTGPLAELADDRWKHESPYRGLWPFGQNQSEVFYGRSRLTAELTGQLAGCLDRTGMVIVTGASGAGKSSLVRAGLIPAIAKGQLPVEGSADWPVLQMTPGARPLDELAARLSELAGADAGSIRNTLASRPDQAYLYSRQAVFAHTDGMDPDRRDLVRRSGRLLVFVDQFEETFTLARDETERSAFLGALFAIASGGDAPSGAVVIGVRGDFIDRCAAVPAMVPVLRAHSFVVGPPEPEELRQVITGPAAAAGLRLEPGLADDLLADLRAAASGGAYTAGALPLLSQTMLSIWQRRDSAPDGDRLTRAAYNEIGGVGRAIEASAEEVHLRLTPRQRKLTVELFRRLTVIDRHGEASRRRIRRSELLAEFPDLAPVLERFTASRLIVMVGDSVEIAHDVLLRSWKRLDTWLQSDRMHRALLTEVADDAAEWLDHRKDPSFLYQGAKFENAQNTRAAWESNPDTYREWNSGVESFLNAAGRAATRRKLGRRTVSVSLVGLLAVSVVAAGFAFNANASLTDERNRLLSEDLAAASLEMSGRDGDLARLLAAASWDLEPTASHQNAMVSTVGDPVTDAVPAHLDDVREVEFSPGGEYVASSGDEGDVVVWSLERGEEQSRIEGLEDPGPLAFSPDGKELAFADADGVHIVNPANATEQQVFDAPETVAEFEYTADGNFLLARADTEGGTSAWKTEDYTAAEAPEETRPEWDSDEDGSSYSAGGQYAIEWSADAITLVDLEQNLPVRTAHTDDRITDAAVNADGSTIALAVGTEVRYITTEEMTPVETFDTAYPGAQDLDVSDDGTRLAATGEDGTRIWEFDDEGDIVPEPVFDAPDLPGRLVRLHPNGEQIMVVDAGSYRLFDIATGEEIEVPWDTEDWIAHVSFSPDGKWITVIDGENNTEGDDVSLTLDEHATILEAETGKVHMEIEPVNGETAMLGEDTVAYSPDGTQVAAISDKILKVWDLETGNVVAEVEDNFSGTSGLRYSADGDRVVATGDTAPIVWDQSENTTFTMAEPPSAESDFSFDLNPVASLTADGAYVVQTGTSDRTVRIWDADTGEYITALAMTGGQVLREHLPGGSEVLGLDENGTVFRQQFGFLSDPYDAVCDETGRTLTEAEWNEYLPGLGYSQNDVCKS